MPDPKRLPTVLLRHDLPDGAHHFDWMLARDDNGLLMTFRLDRDISLDTNPFEGDLLADHRRAYLEYEGEISGNRGVVIRVSTGLCTIHTCTDQMIELSLAMGTRIENLRGIRQQTGRFLFGSREY